MSQRPSTPAGPTRRTIAASAAWSIPVVSAAVAAPLAAASPATCRSTTMFSPSKAASTPTVLTAVSPTGVASTVRITSVLAPGTTTETEGRSFDLTRDGTVWAAVGGPRSAEEVLFAEFEPGPLLLNQRRAGAITETPPPGSDAQTLTFEFLDSAGRSFDPLDVRLEIQNITSYVLPGYPWVLSRWTTVGFSVAPASISSRGGDAGAGSGVMDDPFRRATSSAPPPQRDHLVDTFTFGVFPSGSTLTYGQHEGHQGWHASALSALSFVSQNC
ncbi:hypothetical protein GTU73_03670 [Rathayibacter sp. VKM Ac-2804]|uniref:hypothetical protein n=1 Tax=Rathayibacter sp. VKM Ac-2804 TaxID=2609257 RepID=UPI00132E9975|nr:hypothetical protein [Rathayibacter sp. VKM Ac-2804]QHF23192.1 hypothetical protein GTU73_03670 [Rathayibacter sp. VKM Ac-2804]